LCGWVQLGEAIEAAMAIDRGSRQADGLPPPGAPAGDTAP